MKCKRIAVRRTWDFKPVTRVKQSKKIYSRKSKWEKMCEKYAPGTGRSVLD